MSLKINLSKGVYSLDIANRTAYALADKLSILIEDNNEEIILNVFPLHEISLLSGIEVRAIILQHLNDFRLRNIIRQETKDIQYLIIKTALKGSGV